MFRDPPQVDAPRVLYRASYCSDACHRGVTKVRNICSWENTLATRSFYSIIGYINQVTAQDSLPTYANFVVAGASGMSAWMLIHPVDVVKTRMQLLGKERGDATAVSVGKDLVRRVSRNLA